MSDDEEFTVAVGRRYSREHLWFQLISSPNEEPEEYKIGISDFIRVEYGKITRATLPNMSDGGGFKIDTDDDSEEEEMPTIAADGDEKIEQGIGELSTDDNLVGIRCEFETLNILSPIPCTIIGLNGEVENTPQLVNRDAYGDGWLINVRPHDGFDFDDLMTAEEYVDYLDEL
tara:strand:- start:65 stop:583 length:519 start_codon:yes stop_codon:yes gene_type:complete